MPGLYSSEFVWSSWLGYFFTLSVKVPNVARSTSACCSQNARWKRATLKVLDNNQVCRAFLAFPFLPFKTVDRDHSWASPLNHCLKFYSSERPACRLGTDFGDQRFSPEATSTGVKHTPGNGREAQSFNRTGEYLHFMYRCTIAWL